MHCMPSQCLSKSLEPISKASNVVELRPALPYSIDLFAVDGDKVLIDACVPGWIGAEMLRLLATI